MNPEGGIPLNRREPWIAGLLSLAIPGLGQAYGGEPGRGLIAFFSIPVLFILGNLFGFGTFHGLVAVLALLVILYLGIAVDAALRARRIREIPLRWYNRPAVYFVLAVLLWILGGQLLSRSLQHLRFRTYKIPAGSMEPTLQIGDFLMADTWAYRNRLPERDDVIIFKSPENPSMDLVKRCVAVGGDTVEIRDKKLSINGRPVLESYAQSTDPKMYSDETESQLGVKRDQLAATKVPPESCFCLGDNRDFSYDSRFFGAVSHDLIRAKPLYIYWSKDTSRIGQRIH